MGSTHSLASFLEYRGEIAHASVEALHLARVDLVTSLWTAALHGSANLY